MFLLYHSCTRRNFETLLLRDTTITRVINLRPPEPSEQSFSNSTVEQNAKHGKVAPGVYLHFTNQSKILSLPIWVPKTHSPKGFKLVFKKTQTAQVILKNKDKFSSAINIMCLFVFKTCLFVFRILIIFIPVSVSFFIQDL